MLTPYKRSNSLSSIHREIHHREIILSIKMHIPSERAIWSNICWNEFGITPLSSGGSGLPSIVCVFPEPVCPYAKTGKLRKPGWPWKLLTRLHRYIQTKAWGLALSLPHVNTTTGCSAYRLRSVAVSFSELWFQDRSRLCILMHQSFDVES